MPKPPEAWLRGPVPGVPPALQPVAHALLQVREDLVPLLTGLSAEELWARPGSSAPIGYHVAHLTGSLGRLFTYARGDSLTADQVAILAAEKTVADARPPVATLLAQLEGQLDRAMAALRATPEDALYHPREVGRARLPSSTIGLLCHAAEHSARHAGQIITLARVLRK